MEEKQDLNFPQQKRRFFGYPFTYFILPFIIFIIQLWASQGAKNFYDQNVASIINWKVPIVNIPLITLLLIATIVYMIFQVKVQRLIDDLNYQKLINKYYLEQIDNKSKLMWRNYEKLVKIKDTEIFNNVIKQFVEQNSYVYGIQLYSYTIKFISEKTRIKIDYKHGFVDDCIDLNGMIQKCFEFDSKLYQSFYKQVLRYEKDDLETKIKNIGSFIEEYTNQLIKKGQTFLDKSGKDEDITEEEFNKYAILLLAYQILYSSVNKSLEFDILDNLKEYEDKLKKYRTGILRGILYDSYYVFKHDSSNGKDDRFYASIPMDVKGRKYIIIITFNKSISDINDINELADKLINEIENSLDKCYNLNEYGYF